MKKSIAYIFLMGIAIGLLQISGCGGDPEPDPCLEKQMIKGSFTIGERITNYGGVDTLLVSDTVLTNNLVVFKADSDYVSYEWKIGSDTRVFTTKEVKLRIAQPESSIPVRLIVKWPPDKVCFPQDDGIDTVYKHLTVIDFYKNPILGSYKGYVKSNPSDFFNVTVSMENVYVPDCDCAKDPKYCGCDYVIRNINKDCDAFPYGIGGLRIAVGYKILNFQWKDHTCQQFACSAPKGWLRIDEFGKNATIEFTTLPSMDCNRLNDKRIKDIFYGRKTN